MSYKSEIAVSPKPQTAQSLLDRLWAEVEGHFAGRASDPVEASTAAAMTLALCLSLFGRDRIDDVDTGIAGLAEDLPAQVRALIFEAERIRDRRGITA